MKDAFGSFCKTVGGPALAIKSQIFNRTAKVKICRNQAKSLRIVLMLIPTATTSAISAGQACQ